jgi:predicted aspartyl protease
LKRSWKILSLVVVWAVIGSVQAMAQSQRPASLNRSDVGPPRVLLPLRIYRDFLVAAEGQIGGVSGTQNVVLDTGVSPTIISSNVAKQLGLPTIASTMAAVGRSIPTKMAVLLELKLGPIHTVSLPVQVQDLSRLEHHIGIPIAAIIGMDVLSQSSFRLDYQRQQIEFGDVSDQGLPVAFDPQAGAAVTTVQLAGVTARLVVDTGSEHVVVFGRNFPVRQMFALRNTSSQGSNVGDQRLRVQEFAAPDLVIAGQHFPVNKAYLVPDSSDPSFDGLLGLRALGLRAIAYDRSRRQIYLQK